MIHSDLQTDPTARILPSIFHELEKLGHTKEKIFNRAGINIQSSRDEFSLSAIEKSSLFNYACCLLASETSSQQPKNNVQKNVLIKHSTRKTEFSN